MAFPKTNHLLLRTLHLATATIFILLTLSSSSSSSLSSYAHSYLNSHSPNKTEFSFSSFTSLSRSQLIFEGDATVIPSDKTLQLTKTSSSSSSNRRTGSVETSVGRVTYASPVHIWDNTTTTHPIISTFSTTFKFVITSTKKGKHMGDGLTFFIGPPGACIPNESEGGFFGLFQNNTLGPNVELANSSYQIIAVEFDTYVDDLWDPNYGGDLRHIGINVNTVRSKAIIPWELKLGEELTVEIKYNPKNKLLFISSSYHNGPTYGISSSIDLVEVLPEFVWVGFSASNGDGHVETHNVNFWNFSSKLDHDNSSYDLDDAPLYFDE